MRGPAAHVAHRRRKQPIGTQQLASALRGFAHASVIQTTDEELGEEDNYLLIASDEDYSFADAIAYGEDFPGEPLFD